MGKRQKREYQPSQIRAWRKSKDRLSLEELAPKVNMTASNLSKVERGELPYTQHLIEALARYYGVEPYEVLRGPKPSGQASRELYGLSGADLKNLENVLTVIRAITEKAA